MKYIFIVNPYAGKEESDEGILEQLRGRKFDYDIYRTKEPMDATVYVKTYCMKHPKEEVCFVACGGDGTLNEIVNGIYGYKNACISVYPCGSGNDYVKYFGGVDCFKNIDNILDGEKIEVDVIEVNGKYSVNVVNFGLDCVVLNTMRKVKRIPLLGGRNSYSTGVIKAVFVGRNNRARITVDGEPINPDGHYCLCTIANGMYVGGSYKCAPRSLANDGLMEVCMIKPVSLFTFLKMSGAYQEGKHLEDERFKPITVYRQAEKVEITSEEPMDVSVDGEVITDTHFKVEIREHALTFVQPKGSRTPDQL